jgi:Antibiotic biosynthesis monooxygenase
VKPEDVDQLLRAWAADAAFFKQQPGFISTELHRGIGGSCVSINCATWESTEHYKQAFNNPEFVSKMREYLPVLWYRLVYSRKLYSLGFVWIEAPSMFQRMDYHVCI